MKYPFPCMFNGCHGVWAVDVAFFRVGMLQFDPFEFSSLSLLAYKWLVRHLNASSFYILFPILEPSQINPRQRYASVYWVSFLTPFLLVVIPDLWNQKGDDFYIFYVFPFLFYVRIFFLYTPSLISFSKHLVFLVFFHTPWALPHQPLPALWFCSEFYLFPPFCWYSSLSCRHQERRWLLNFLCLIFPFLFSLFLFSFESPSLYTSALISFS